LGCIKAPGNKIQLPLSDKCNRFIGALLNNYDDSNYLGPAIWLISRKFEKLADSN
jgi:hypothetical protein